MSAVRNDAANARPAAPAAPALIAQQTRKLFRVKDEPAVLALAGVSLEAHHGELTALVGPDGAGKTTLMRLAAGLLRADGGSLTVLGVDVAADPQQVQDRISYMPQRFGLYEDLTVAENLDLYADLHGVSAAERAQRYPELIEMTALGPFRTRLAGQLSGGMKQKLGLACTLVRSPELLLLDEPTVGVDPLSRRELWDIVRRLVADQGLTVLLSTAYLDEAERCSRVIMLHQGRVLSQGAPQQIAALAAGRCFVATRRAAAVARARCRRGCWISRTSSMPCPMAAACAGARRRGRTGRRSGAPGAGCDRGGAARTARRGGRAALRGRLHGAAARPGQPGARAGDRDCAAGRHPWR